VLTVLLEPIKTVEAPALKRRTEILLLFAPTNCVAVVPTDTVVIESVEPSMFLFQR